MIITKTQPLSNSGMAELNKVFEPLSPLQRLQCLYHYFEPEEVLYTSSFGTQAALLLYWVSNVKPTQKVHFIDTGYHFEETLAFRDRLGQILGLEIINIRPDVRDHQQSEIARLWETNPDACCSINKTSPLAPVKAKHKIWISGLMSHQNQYRRDLQVFQRRGNLLKFHPLIDLSENDFYNYYQQASLPRHPLTYDGYGSVGCIHCTQKGCGREGRWAGMEKTECGIHF